MPPPPIERRPYKTHPEDYELHPAEWRDREILLGPIGDQVRMIPECPCIWCECCREGRAASVLWQGNNRVPEGYA